MTIQFIQILPARIGRCMWIHFRQFVLTIRIKALAVISRRVYVSIGTARRTKSKADKKRIKARRGTLVDRMRRSRGRGLSYDGRGLQRQSFFEQSDVRLSDELQEQERTRGWRRNDRL